MVKASRTDGVHVYIGTLPPQLGVVGGVITVQHLPQPPTFATIAGLKNALWYVSEPSDGLVKAKETHLSGEAAHMEMPVAHTFIMNDQRVIDFVSGFIGRS